jgi:hypothetical protein
VAIVPETAVVVNVPTQQLSSYIVSQVSKKMEIGQTKSALLRGIFEIVAAGCTHTIFFVSRSAFSRNASG